MNGWSKGTTYLAVVMMAGGFLLIVLGWNGAASLDYIQGQIPFVLSGGMAGLGLVMGGVALTIIQEMRRTTGALAARLDRIAGLLEHEVAVEETENLPAPRIQRHEGAEAKANEPALT